MNTFLIIAGIIIALIIIVKFKDIVVPILQLCFLLAILGGIIWVIYYVIKNWESILSTLSGILGCLIFFFIIWLFNLEDPNGKKQ